MARSDPTRSDYCATRHLLRHLRHARELRRNPLAHDAFAAVHGDAALGAIASRVYAALRSMDARWPTARQHARYCALLMRVDVQRHDPARVASDLGLSTRQFHRERRVAHERFFEAYRATLPSALDGVPSLPHELVVHAAGLADSGEIASASALLDDVARNADAADRCAALVQLAEIDAWTHRLDRARAGVRAARDILLEIPAGEPRYEDLHDAYAALALLLQWFECGPSAVRARNGDERAAALPGPRETFVRAAAALRSGEAADASRLLRRLNAVSRPLPIRLTVDLLTLQGEVSDYNAEDESVSERLFEHAEAMARANGLSGRALYATHQLALTRWAHTRSAFDRDAYRSLVDGVDRSLAPRLRSYLIFSSADVELAIGHPRRALRAAQTAASISTNHYETFSAQGLAAGALLRLGRVADAGEQAARAADAARKEGHARVISLAQRIQALAQLSQGNRRAALAAIEESIAYAKRFSSAHALAQTRAVLGRITAR